MSPSNTVKATNSKRQPRKALDDEDIQLKRLRGEISCAECRRLKLKCDKKVPCSSCLRRGCHSVCPSGTLTAGQGTRFILADTEHLHRKIAAMSVRIRQLEDALAILHASVASERHPLLQDDLLKIKFGSEALNAPTTLEVEDPHPEESIEALGTLTLGDRGEMKYYGGSAGSETLLMAGEEWDTEYEDELKSPSMPAEVLENTLNIFPFSSRKPQFNVFEMLEPYLPPRERALSLCEIYIDHGAYFFRPFTRDHIFENILKTIYNSAEEKNSPELPPKTSDSHKLAALLFVFAMGALLDLSLPAYNAEAEHYYELGRTALSMRSVFDAPQVETVQAIGLMATYHSLAGRQYTRSSAWSIMSLGAKLAQSMGLHRDSARWHLDANTVQSRRVLFWEVFAADVSHSLALGRPPSIHLSYVDCEFPVDEEETLDDTGASQCGFWRLKYMFGKDIFMSIAEMTLAAKAPSYSAILDLDKKVRQTTFPASFRPYVMPEDSEYHSPSLSIRGFYASQNRTVTMIYLHRSFFSQAMLDQPTNPLRSPFAPSFLTAYRCASVVIKAALHQFGRCAELAMRLWFLLYHTFSAAVIVGTVVTRSPNSSMASSALVELGLAVELFQRTAGHSRRAKIAFNVLRKLQDKAVRSYSDFCSGVTTHPTGPFSVGRQDDDDDDLAIFGGQTSVLARNSRLKGDSISPADDSSWMRIPASSVSPHGQSIGTSSLPSSDVITGFHSSYPNYLSNSPGRNLAAVQEQLQSDKEMDSPALSIGSMCPPLMDLIPNSSQPTNWDPLPREDYSPFSWFEPIRVSGSPSMRQNQTPGLLGLDRGTNAMAVNQAPYPIMDSLQLVESEYPANQDALDLGLTSESGMDEHWRSFMHECGILDNNSYGGMT